MGIIANFGALVAVAVAVALAVYPCQRVMHGYEYATDSQSGAVIANLVQDVLQELWRDSFQSGAVDPKGQVASALAETFQRQGATSLVELCAGAGGASISWVGELRKRSIAARAVLTDINPNIDVWAGHKAALGDVVSYVPEPVDATNMTGELALQVRSINMALHHFPPELVRKILADVVLSRSAIFIGDLAPNRWNVLLNGPVAVAAALRLGMKNPQRMVRHPASALLVMPIVGPYDAVVSVLRAYSADQLRAISKDIPGSENYQWAFFDSDSAIAVLIGPAARNLVASPYMQFSMFAPRA